MLSRLPGVWRAITQLRKRVPDRYYDMAPDRVNFEGAIDVDQLVAALRRSHYRVERSTEAGTTYLFADRFAWAQVGSLLTHVAGIVFILAAVVSKADAFESPLFLAEGSTLPVFPVRDEEQIQVELRDAEGEFAPTGQPLDYQLTDLTLYRRGEEAVTAYRRSTLPAHTTATSSTSPPTSASAPASKCSIWRPAAPPRNAVLTGISRLPRVTIRDAMGVPVVNETLVLTDELNTGAFSYRGDHRRDAGRPPPDGRTADRAGGEDPAVLEPETATASSASAGRGRERESGGLFVAYERDCSAFAVVSELPLAAGGAGDGLTLQLSATLYTAPPHSEGDLLATTEASVHLANYQRPGIAGVDARPGESTEIGGYRYTFLGQREFAGITVRRDRSDGVGGCLADSARPDRHVLGAQTPVLARITQTRAYSQVRRPRTPSTPERARSGAGGGSKLPEETLSDD